MSEHANPLSILTTEAEVAGWNSQHLPADRVSTENGAIVMNSDRWPLLIDPQLQGVQWLKERFAGNVEILRLGSSGIMRKMEAAIIEGKTVIIENMLEKIDAPLMPVVSHQVLKKGRKEFIRLGDNEVEVHENFRLFLHTKLANPHYPPEIQAETTVVNFTVTESGLEDQLLSLVVRKERADCGAACAPHTAGQSVQDQDEGARRHDPPKARGC